MAMTRLLRSLRSCISSQGGKPRGVIAGDVPDEQLVEPDSRDEQGHPDEKQVDVQQEKADLMSHRKRMADNAVDRMDEDGDPVGERAETSQRQERYRYKRHAERSDENPLRPVFQGPRGPVRSRTWRRPPRWP